MRSSWSYSVQAWINQWLSQRAFRIVFTEKKMLNCKISSFLFVVFFFTFFYFGEPGGLVRTADKKRIRFGARKLSGIWVLSGLHQWKPFSKRSAGSGISGPGRAQQRGWLQSCSKTMRKSHLNQKWCSQKQAAQVIEFMPLKSEKLISILEQTGWKCWTIMFLGQQKKLLLICWKQLHLNKNI